MDYWITLAKVYIARWLLMGMSWFYRTEKKVLFSSFSGKQYSDNLRTVSEKMHERKYPDRATPYIKAWQENKIESNTICYYTHENKKSTI